MMQSRKAKRAEARKQKKQRKASSFKSEPKAQVRHSQPKKRERELKPKQHKKARQKKARRDDNAGPSFQMEPDKTPEEIEIEYLEAKLGIRGSNKDKNTKLLQREWTKFDGFDDEGRCNI